MTDESPRTLFGQSPNRSGVASLVAACLAIVSWPLMVMIGFVMVYVAFLLALVALVSGLMGVGSGIYYLEWAGAVTGAIGAVLAGGGVCFVVAALSNF